MEKSTPLIDKHFSTKASKTNTESRASFNKKEEEIQLAFVDLDCQLKQLQERHRQGNISKVRHFIVVQEIRNRLFELCNFSLYNLNVREFASHKPGEKTPLNARC